LPINDVYAQYPAPETRPTAHPIKQTPLTKSQSGSDHETAIAATPHARAGPTHSTVNRSAFRRAIATLLNIKRQV